MTDQASAVLCDNALCSDPSLGLSLACSALRQQIHFCYRREHLGKNICISGDQDVSPLNNQRDWISQKRVTRFANNARLRKRRQTLEADAFVASDLQDALFSTGWIVPISDAGAPPGDRRHVVASETSGLELISAVNRGLKG
jgi:hypothetical protein